MFPVRERFSPAAYGPSPERHQALGFAPSRKGRLGHPVTILRATNRESENRIIALPLALAAPQGCVALCAPVLRTPLSRVGFAVAGTWDGG